MPALAQQVIDRVNAVQDELAITADVTPEEEKLITVIGARSMKNTIRMC